MYVCVYVFIYACICDYVCMYNIALRDAQRTFEGMYVCMRACINTHTYMHAYIHTYIHTYIGDIAVLTEQIKSKEDESRDMQMYIITLTERLNEYVEESNRRASVDEHTNSVIAKLRSKNEALIKQISESEVEKDRVLQVR